MISTNNFVWNDKTKTAVAKSDLIGTAIKIKSEKDGRVATFMLTKEEPKARHYEPNEDTLKEIPQLEGWKLIVMDRKS